MKPIIIIVLALSVILGFVFWRFGPSIQLFNQAEPEGPITLIYWGFWEDDNLIKPLILEYQRQNPKVIINYVKQSTNNYRTRVQTQIREGVGPDVFKIHNSWMPMLQSYLAWAPATVFNPEEYKDMFYPVAVASFVQNNQILASSMEIDGLALFYNEEMLSGIGGKPPKNWQEFTDTASKMTVKDASGIKTPGASLGSTNNVDHWSDLIGLLLFQQPGVDFNNLATDGMAGIFRFYTGFVIDPKKKVWDISFPSSTEMFASGRLGFYFAPAWRIHDIKTKNPNLKFKVVPVPQLSSSQAAYGSFWAEAVSKNSKNIEEAWKFVKFLTSDEAQRSLSQQAPPSHTSLAAEMINDPLFGAYVAQGPIYKSWYLSSNTFDNGINDEMIKYFEDGINATLAGTDPAVVLQTVNNGVKQVLDKYTQEQPGRASPEAMPAARGLPR